MKHLWFLLAIAVLPFVAAGQEIIAKDSNGLVVDIKADFGRVTRETCTVVVLTQENFVLVGKNGKTAWYPLPFHSVKIVEHLKTDPDPLATAEQTFGTPGGRLHER
jgi:hypothetical protein